MNLDSDYVDRILEEAQASKKIITFSIKNSKADVYAYNIQKTSHTSISFKVKTPQWENEILLTMPGLFNVENALAAICVALTLSIPYENIYEGLKVARASGRMESHMSKDGSIIVIVDYAHNKLSFENLLHNFSS